MTLPPAYVDDVLVCSQGSLEDHMAKVRRVPKRMSAHGLHLDPNKCEFAAKKVEYLGFVILTGVGVQANPDKIDSMVKWVAPTLVSGIRSFLGSANFYRMFIPNFSKVAAPLTEFMGKGAVFE